MSDQAEKTSVVEEPEPLLPPAVQVHVDKVVSIWRRLPMAVKVFIGATLFTIAAIGTYISLAPMLRDDAVLFSQLEHEDAAAIVEKLNAQNIPYELAGDGTTIRVPEERVHELRLSLASEGLPRGGQVGFESFENMRLGATEFEQHVTYRRAMEGELARTISTVSAVKSARVHLVMPRKSVFAQKREPASASVVVKLSGGTLAPDEVNGIVNLVASAVPGLAPETIALVTTDGRMLHRPRPSGDDGGVSPIDSDQLEATRAIETTLEQRAREQLERVLGPGQVDVRVSAEVDTAKVERKTDTYNPEQTALRSEQVSEERVGGAPGAPDTVAGVPGAEANLPGGEAIVGEAGEQNQGTDGGILRKSYTKNHEVSHEQERRISVAQDVKRLTVAVAINDAKKNEQGEVVPRTDAEIAALQALVQNAIGFDVERGDSMTIEAVPFFEQDIPEPAPEPELLPIPEPYKPLVDKWMPLAKIVLTGLLALIGFLYVRRKIRKGVAAFKKRQRELKAAEETKAALAAARIEKQTEEKVLEVDYRVEALGKAQTDPATAALILRNWLGTSTKKDDGKPAEQAA